MVPFVFAGPELCVAEGATARLLLVLRLPALLRAGLSLWLQQELHDLAHRRGQGAAVVGQGEVAQEGGDLWGVAVFLVDDHLPLWKRVSQLARFAFVREGYFRRVPFGVEALPHLEMWKDLPFLVRDGVIFAVDTIKSKGRPGYDGL